MTGFLARMQHDRRIEHIDDERVSGNGIIVTLRKGWTFDPLCDNRVAGADTITEFRALLARAVVFAGPYSP